MSESVFDASKIALEYVDMSGDKFIMRDISTGAVNEITEKDLRLYLSHGCSIVGIKLDSKGNICDVFGDVLVAVLKQNKNKNLLAAQQEKNDEFYTQLSDIEAELSKYPEGIFKDKVVYCPMDVATESGVIKCSEFVHYFQIHAEELGFKELIATCLQNKVGCFDSNDYHLVKEGQGYREVFYPMCPSDVDYLTEDSDGSGDFRSWFCLEYLEKADIVVTNPPFSLFYEFLRLLLQYEKKFLILGGMHFLTGKFVFSAVKENKIWLGYTNPKKFLCPDGSLQSFGNIIWFTNIEHNKRYEPLVLTKKYVSDTYPKYDNYDAIEVSSVKDIPGDYFGCMGVPVTFLGMYCPEQFEILGLTCTAETMDVPVLIGEDFVHAYHAAGGTAHISANMYGVTLFGNADGKKPKLPYGRVIIRRRR